MTLEDDVILLEPFTIADDISTVVDLVMKCRYTRLTSGEAREALLMYPTIAWKGYDKETGLFIGVVYLTQTPKYWTLDAYRDDELVKEIDRAMDYSYRAGKLVSDYAFTFTDKLYTVHAYENRGATIVCKKLGFKEDFLFMRKDK